ncbi:MAG: LysR family transcriptional regulator [Sandaracinaceae bacterium]
MEEPHAEIPITLDQLRVFLAVVEEGSFSSAARRLRRVQSAVSYAIANLERLLEVELFDRSGRRPVLTPAGRALVADARAVGDRVDRLQARARHFARGVEAQIGLAVDMLFPLGELLDAIRAFRAAYPTVALHLRTEALGAIAQLVLEGVCQIGISTELEDGFPRELSSYPLTEVELAAVCSPSHPLAELKGPLGAAELEEAVQIVVTDRSARTRGRDRGVLSPRTWRVADVGSKRELLLAGLGWGNMPLQRVADDLRQGRLIRLQVQGFGAGERLVPLFAVHRTSEPPGPAGTWLLERLGRQGPTGDPAGERSGGD